MLIILAEKGLERQKAYVMVQRNAMRAWERKEEFKDLILDDQEIRAFLNQDEIDEIFSLDYHIKYVDEIFERVFKS